MTTRKEYMLPRRRQSARRARHKFLPFVGRLVTSLHATSRPQSGRGKCWNIIQCGDQGNQVDQTQRRCRWLVQHLGYFWCAASKQDCPFNVLIIMSSRFRHAASQSLKTYAVSIGKLFEIHAPSFRNIILTDHMAFLASMC